MLAKLATEMAVHVRRVRIKTFERLMHDLHFCFEEFVLLVRFAAVVGVALEALDLGVELAFVLLGVADVFDCCSKC